MGMGILYATLAGLGVGILAKLVMPARDPEGIGGIIITALLGVAGSMLAFLIGRAAGWYGPHSDGPGVIAAVIGAVVVLACYWLFAPRRVE